MKKIISLILCFTLLTFVVQLSATAENASKGGMTVNALSDNTAITVGNGKGTASNIFTIDDVNTYVEGANVILFYPRKFNDNLNVIPCVQNFIDANSSFPYSDYADYTCTGSDL